MPLRWGGSGGDGGAAAYRVVVASQAPSATATVLNWSASRGFSLSVDKGWHQRRYKCVELYNPKMPPRLTHATETA